ncbi:hypothetical protein ACFX5U_07700 [Sphingobacterium sp. SG20118]|uniref:hypothetical protein n=1 Tax=Sphingobacterium sp. SG20118 TaxID=3367156 RepID=UPI0037DFC182
MNNSDRNSERKFTIAKLELRKFDTWDIVILSIFTLAVVSYLVLDEYHSEKRFQITYFSSFAAAFLIFTTAFGLRFRNIKFSVIWLILSLMFLYENYPIAQIPLLGFVSYHIVRLIFWKMYKKEFIPYELGRGGLFRYISKIEKKGGNKTDRLFTKILLAIESVIFTYGISSLVGIKV